MSTVADLNSDANKLLASWFKRNLEAMPEPRPMNWAIWTVDCRSFYDLYVKWCAGTPFRLVSPQVFWEVLKATFPKTEIVFVGKNGDKCFDKIRMTYPMTEEDYAREEKAKQLKLRWNAKFGESDG